MPANDLEKCPICGNAPLLMNEWDKKIPYKVMCVTPGHDYARTGLHSSVSDAVDEWNCFIVKEVEEKSRHE